MYLKTKLNPDNSNKENNEFCFNRTEQNKSNM